MFAATQLALVCQPVHFLFQLVITQCFKKITDEGIEDKVDLVLTLWGGRGNWGILFIILAFFTLRLLG